MTNSLVGEHFFSEFTLQMTAVCIMHPIIKRNSSPEWLQALTSCRGSDWL